MGFPFGPDFDEDAYLEMMTSLGIVHGDGRPRINATLAEIMDMDIRLFLRLWDQLQDDLASWFASMRKRAEGK